MLSQTSSNDRQPPYAPTVEQNGGIPTVIPDIPISAVLICFYLTGAVINMTIFQVNRRRGIKFIPQAALFGFCMARTATLVLRIAWATRQHNVRLGIAASILVQAGILIIYILNLIFAQRILRARKPSIGWHPITRAIFKVLIVAIIGALIMVITATVLSFYTLNAQTKKSCRDVQLAASCYLLFFTVLPWVYLGIAFFTPKHHNAEHFGEGSMEAKGIIVACSTCLAVIISGFKTGTAFMDPRRINDPAWYQSKAAFYIFTFVLEILILFLLVPVRLDKRFHVANGSHGPGDYSRRILTEKDSAGSQSFDETKSETTV